MDSSKKSILVGFSLGIMAAVLGFGIYFFLQVRTLTIQNSQSIQGIVQFLNEKYPAQVQAPQTTQPENK
ncbi:hypothetical protein HZB93_02060 [Candidatus Falkowbacteria bacterium]|nr:hypothetical protein [Candidatus Falkowbacteria bacterium]